MKCGEIVARIFHPGIALMIEELHRKAGINSRLIGIGQRPSHLVQAEPGQQRGFVGNAVIDAHRKLVGARVYLR